MVQKNLLKKFRIDLGSVGVFTIFSESKQSKNDEVLFDFEGGTDCIISQIFYGYFCFGLTPRNKIIFWQELLS